MTRRARVGTALSIFLVIGIPGAFMYLVTMVGEAGFEPATT